jgi:hypothetical protein
MTERILTDGTEEPPPTPEARVLHLTALDPLAGQMVRDLVEWFSDGTGAAA